MSMLASTHGPAVMNAEDPAPNRDLPQPQRGARERELLQVFSSFVGKFNVKLCNVLSCLFSSLNRLFINSVMQMRS